MKLVFFGSLPLSIYVLDELLVHGIKPSLLISLPDQPKGRKLVVSPTPEKVWALEHGVEVLQPTSLNNSDIKNKLKEGGYDIFLVASYGKMIPKEIFEIPKYKTLNIHPSLLPKYRGPSPIVSQILNNEKEVGVTLMQIEETMDTGPIVVQKVVKLEEYPIGKLELEKKLAIEGARLFTHVYPEWEMGAIQGVIQNEDNATYCSKVEKEDGRLDIDLNNLEKDALKNLLKIKAFEEWPRAFFILDDKRVIITDAKMNGSALEILRVIPEGKNEMPFSDFLRGRRD